MELPSQDVKRTPYAAGAALQDVRIDHGGRHVFVPQKLLHGADVGAGLQQVSGEAVPESVAGHTFSQSSRSCSTAYG